jgi:hypothetical protein
VQHSSIDQRSLDLDRIVIRRLQENPSLVNTAQATLQRWLSTSSDNVRPDLLKWKELLDGDFEALLGFLGSDSPEATRLRQSSPFAGTAFITREERTIVFRQYRNKGVSVARAGHLS